MLWGLAAALPILIHLWSRRRYREESWAAMTFLLAALRKNARRIQLEQWMLLAVRTLLVAALRAGPGRSAVVGHLRPGSAARAGRRTSCWCIDGSYSMDYRRSDAAAGCAGKSRFDAARQLAKQIVAGRPAGGRLHAGADGRAAARRHRPAGVRSAATCVEEIDNLELPHAGAQLPATLAEVETILRQAGESHRG